MAGEELPEDSPVEEGEGVAAEGEAQEETPLDEDILVVLPDEEGGGAGMDSFFDEAEANVETTDEVEVQSSPEPEAILDLAQAEETEAPPADEPAADTDAGAAPVPVTILDVEADGFRFVYPQITEYLGQGYLFFIVNASAVGAVPEDDLTILADLDSEVRGPGGQLVFCSFQDDLRSTVNELGLYDSLSLTDTEDEAIDWTRKIVMENTGSDVEISRVPLGGGEAPESAPPEAAEELEAEVTQPMDLESDGVVDLSEEAIVEEEVVAEEEPPFEEAPADFGEGESFEPTPEMVTQEIPGDYGQYAQAETEEPADHGYQVIHEPMDDQYGATRVRPRARRAILLMVVMLGIVAIGFQQFDLGPKILNYIKGAKEVAIGPPPPDFGVDLPTGGGVVPPTRDGSTGGDGSTPPAVDVDREAEGRKYEETLLFTLTDILERR